MFTDPVYKNNGDDSSGILSSAIVVRNRDGTLAKLSESSAAGQFLQSRSYRGLDARVGVDAPSVLEQGRSGIAKGYQEG